MVAGEAGFVARLAGDVAAGHEESVTACSSAWVTNSTAGSFDRFEGGLRRQHREVVEWGEDSTLVGPVGVEVNNERRATGVGSAAAIVATTVVMPPEVVPVPVRQEQHVDAGEVDGEPFGVGQPDIAVGADVEQDGRGAVVVSCGGEC